LGAKSVSFHSSFFPGCGADPPSTVEFAVLTYDEATKAPKAKIYKPAEIDALLRAQGLAKKDEDAEMKS